MDLVLDIVFCVAYILSIYLWYKVGRNKGYAEGVKKTLRAFEEVFEKAMEREEEG